MIYELREYVAAPGAAERLHRRFADATLDLLARHGLRPLGFWQDREDPGRINYLLRFADEDERASAWAAFQDDEDWQRVKRESEADGPVVAEQISRVLVVPGYFNEDEGLRAAQPEED
jgi:hypothetical protein